MCLKTLYTCHNEWVRIITKFGGGTFAEDLVQETYIKIEVSGACSKAVENGQINRAFMWIALRNNYLNYYKAKIKVTKLSLDEIKPLCSERYNEQKHKAYDKIIEDIENEVNGWNDYYKNMFSENILEGVSYRVLHKETGIGLSSIANTIKQCKEQIKDKVWENYLDYLNKEYERV